MRYGWSSAIALGRKKKARTLRGVPADMGPMVALESTETLYFSLVVAVACAATTRRGELVAEAVERLAEAAERARAQPGRPGYASGA